MIVQHRSFVVSGTRHSSIMWFKLLYLVAIIAVIEGQRRGRRGRGKAIPSECLSNGFVCTDAAKCVRDVGSTCAKDLLKFDETAAGLDDKLKTLNHEAFLWDKERFLKRHEIMESEFVKCLETYASKSELKKLGAMCPTTQRKKREVDDSQITRVKRRSRGRKTNDIVRPDIEYLPKGNSMRQIYDIKEELGTLDAHLWTVCNYSSCMDTYTQSCISTISDRVVDVWEYCTANIGDIVDAMRDIEMEEGTARACHTGQVCNQTMNCIQDVKQACENAEVTRRPLFEQINQQLKALGEPGRNWAPEHWEATIQEAEANFKICIANRLSRKETDLINQACPDVLRSQSRKKRSIESNHFTYLHRVKRRSRKNKKTISQQVVAKSPTIQSLLDKLDNIEGEMGDVCCDYACWQSFKDSCVPIISEGARKDWERCEETLDDKLALLQKDN